MTDEAENGGKLGDEAAEPGEVAAVKRPRRAIRPTLILVTDPTYADDRVLEVVGACTWALPEGSFAVQLRDKKKDPKHFLAYAEKLRAATAPSGGPKALLLVNGNAAVAKQVGADGVHLGGSAMSVGEARSVVGEEAFITIAAHSDQAVKLGAQDGADGALVSTIFASPGKSMGRGVDALRTARAVAGPDFAIYALGGVERANAAECVLAGADGVAAIRALLLASDPAAEARAIYDSLHSLHSL
jgi:thiamine-phosphate pyrophosphorylase